MALNALGELARLTGDCALSSTFYNESMQLFQETGFKLAVALVSVNLGEVALQERDFIRAISLFSQSLEIFRQLENPRGLQACLEGFASVAAFEGKYKQAAQLFGTVQISHETMGRTMDPADEMEYSRCIAYVREHLDPTTFNKAWAEGMKMSVNEALHLALKTVEET